ncbi:hypothetical protein MPER_00002, partial [Moniliophthora perniciosa FA553]
MHKTEERVQPQIFSGGGGGGSRFGNGVVTGSEAHNS